MSRHWLLVGAIACALAASVMFYTAGFTAGVSAESAKREAQDAKLLRDAVDRAARAGAALREIGAKLLAAMEPVRGCGVLNRQSPPSPLSGNMILSACR